MELKQLDSNNHSVFSLHYHLILVVKYRKKVLCEKKLEVMKSVAEHIGESQNVTVKEFNGEEDHVHFLLTTKPNCDLSKYINSLKSVSSRKIREAFPEVKESLWKGAFWSGSYCLITTGGAPLSVLKQYIEDQGNKKPPVPRKKRKRYKKVG